MNAEKYVCVWKTTVAHCVTGNTLLTPHLASCEDMASQFDLGEVTLSNGF